MTGRYPARDTLYGQMATERVTVGEAFRQNGYTTGFVGKWHLGDGKYAPENQGFDVNVAGGSSGAPPSYFYPYDEANRESNQGRIDTLKLEDKMGKRTIRGLDEGAKRGEYLTDRLTSEAVQFIRNHEEEPFFLEVAHYAVHTPVQAREDTRARYEEKFEEEMVYTGDSHEYDHTSETKMWQNEASYAAMIHSVDESVGRLVETPEKRGIAEKTAIVLTSDHGGLSARVQSSNRNLATSNTPLRAGKGWLYEGGIRVPLIVKWPGVIEGGDTTDALVEGVDLYPTMLDMASLPLLPQEHAEPLLPQEHAEPLLPQEHAEPLLPQEHADGRSFASVLRNPESETGKVLHWHPTSNERSTGDFKATVIRDGRYKLMHFYGLDKVELYDLSEDIGEENNIAGGRGNVTEERPEKAEEMMQRLFGRGAKKWESRSEIEQAAPAATPRVL